MKRIVLLLTLGLLFVGPGAGGGEKPLFRHGEKLHYGAYVFGWLPVGDAWFEVSEVEFGGKKAYRFDARALGRYVVYTLDIRLRSTVDPESLRSVEFRRREVGSEKREHRVIFDREKGEGVFLRRGGDFSTVKEMNTAPWEKRETFPIHNEVNDILYTLYFARNIGDRVGNRKAYWLVEKSTVWKVNVTVTGRKRLDMGKTGTFDALRIAIEPDLSAEPEREEKFRGLFGVEGSLEVWVDRRTRIPLIVKGRVPFAYVLRPTVSAVLKGWSLPEEG